MVFKHSKYSNRLCISSQRILLPTDVQMDENRESGRVSLGLSVVVRVTLRDGVYHEVLDALDLSHGGRT